MKNHLFTLLLSFCSALSFSQAEKIKISWPEEYKWKVLSDQEDKGVHMTELIPENESGEKWTIIGTTMSIKGAQNVPTDTMMNLMFDQTKANAPKAKLTEIEKGVKDSHPWIIFKIESPRFNNDKNPESQLYFIIQGTQSLYSNFVGVKKKELSADFVEKWSAVFKASEIVTSN